jgi:transcriptional regulator with XRE-family HTH domain
MSIKTSYFYKYAIDQEITGDNAMSIGAKLNKLRMKSGRSLQQLADEIGVSKAHIYELESGKVKNPSVEVLKKLAKLFVVPVTYFIEEDEEVEFQVMFRELEKNWTALDPQDRDTITFMIEAFKNKKKQEGTNEN